MSLQELSEFVTASAEVRVSGLGTKRTWAREGTLHTASVEGSVSPLVGSGIIDFSPNDQVVSVRAGTSIAELQEELTRHGQCLPLLEGFGTVAGSLSINLPHLLEGKCGSWRDWTLGMTLVLADGTIAKSGSHAVKNVAGYDVHKLMIGARGALSVIAEVILRTYPVKSLPEVPEDLRAMALQFASNPDGVWVQRVKRSDLAEASNSSRAFGGFDVPETCTLWRVPPAGTELQRFAGDWVMRPGRVDIEDPTVIRYMKRAKEILDPTGKLNKGAMGVF